MFFKCETTVHLEKQDACFNKKKYLISDFFVIFYSSQS